MYALILRHKTTLAGVIIVHKTQEAVLVGATPLSRVLLYDYTKGLKFYVFDRKTFSRKEKIVKPRNLDAFIETGNAYYSYANMKLEKRNFLDLNLRNILIDDLLYDLEDINDRN